MATIQNTLIFPVQAWGDGCAISGMEAAVEFH